MWARASEPITFATEGGTMEAVREAQLSDVSIVSDSAWSSASRVT